MFPIVPGKANALEKRLEELEQKFAQIEPSTELS